MRDIRSPEEMKKALGPGIVDRILGRKPDISDVVYHYTCPVCGRKKKITVSKEGYYYVGEGQTRLDVVLRTGKCVTCARAAGESMPKAAAAV